MIWNNMSYYYYHHHLTEKVSVATEEPSWNTKYLVNAFRINENWFAGKVEIHHLTLKKSPGHIQGHLRFYNCEGSFESAFFNFADSHQVRFWD